MNKGTALDIRNNMPDALHQILEKREIGEESYAEFFSPKPTLTHDPFLLANMREGVDSLLKSIDEGKRIVVYGDYDVDGITSTALMMKVLRELTDNVTYYIPSRFDEGYGLHTESIDRIIEDGGEFLLTVDCGSVSKEETEYAMEKGLEVLVTDHHTVSSVRAACTVINPKLPEDEYPFKGLAGVGVAYKLALAINRERNINKSTMAELLELATVGTIADIMPIIDENRTIVKFGLRFMHLGCHNKGLRRLIEVAGIDYKTIKAMDISFGIASRINASGRLGDATLGVKLLLAENQEDIERYCTMLVDANSRRRSLQDDAYDMSLDIISNELEFGDFPVVELDDAHEGVVGIVAGKLREKINRPVIIITRNSECCKGTGRSIPGVNLFDMLDKYRDSFISFGGHSAACGFTIEEDEVENLRLNLNEDIAEMLEENEHLFDVDYSFDVELSPMNATLELAECFEMLEPCGKGNETPVVLFKHVRPQNWTFLKNDTKYARFSVPAGAERSIDCLIFKNALEAYRHVESEHSVDIYGTLEINTWKQNRKLQMIVSHIE